jgi:hypothetical protein
VLYFSTFDPRLLDQAFIIKLDAVSTKRRRPPMRYHSSASSARPTVSIAAKVGQDKEISARQREGAI